MWIFYEIAVIMKNISIFREYFIYQIKWQVEGYEKI